MINFIIDILPTTLAAILGSGIAVALVEHYFISNRENVQRKIDWLQKQLHELYGPLYYYSSKNNKIFTLNRKFLESMQKTKPETDISKQIDIANSYLTDVDYNNSKIIEIFEGSFYLIDEKDVDFAIELYQDILRRKKETDKSGKLKTNLEIYRELGEISFMRPTFIQRFGAQFRHKKNELYKLQKLKME